MSEPIPYKELYRQAAEFIRRRAQSPTRAFPVFGRDVTLVEEAEGQSDCLLYACATNASMSNPMGIVHGGVTASLVDTCMGVVCSALSGGAPTPTVTMTVNYARPVPLDADVRVRARAVRVGSSTGQMSAEVFLADRPGEILATATGVYAIRR